MYLYGRIFLAENRIYVIIGSYCYENSVSRLLFDGEVTSHTGLPDGIYTAK